MGHLLEEYGRGVIVAVAVVAVFACLFVGLDLRGFIGNVADVNTDISHEQGEGALDHIVNVREKPAASFSGVDFRIYCNQAFRPKFGVVFTDADGVVVDDVVITSILYIRADGTPMEFIDFYNKDLDVVVINPEHYADGHLPCTLSEFTEKDGKWLMADGAVGNYTGFVTVTYQATDNENQVATVKKTFVVDAAKFAN